MNEHDSDDAVCVRALGGDETFDAGAAYARFRSRAAQRNRRLPFAIGGLVAAAVIAVLAIFAPLSSIAHDFLTIFQPKQFAAVDVSGYASGKKHLNVFPNLGDFGTMHDVLKGKMIHPASAAAASKAAGFRLVAPASLPSEITDAPHYRTMGKSVESFTFSAARAAASSAKAGKTLPAMPVGLDGTTITASLGPVVVTTWGGKERRLVVMQGVAPVVRSSGATLAELEGYLLSLPSIKPELADQIRSIGDPSTTLPVPIMAVKQSSHPVDVNGAAGLGIGDNTGLGAGVVWERDGKIYAVFGTLSEDQVMGVATGLR
ncbi:MAG: hypothetical protein M3R30_00195 [Candidatus Eremiobacteraeota bacterium]|nr:hypothetical protein [Candidatus Eremiobacteraeota bacterium]